MCVVFVLPGERQKTQGSFQTAPVSPAWEDAFSNMGAQQHEEYLCKKESDQYLLPASQRYSLQSNKVEIPAVAFQPLTVSLSGAFLLRMGLIMLTVPLGRSGGGAADGLL